MSTWVFLRGLTREARHWGSFPQAFRAQFPEAKILTPDLPGNGQLHLLTSPLSVREMLEYCRTELASCGHAAPYHLLGLSLGAMVSVEWAARYPQELAGCVLINTSLRPFSTFYQRLRPRNYMSLLKLALLQNDAETIERAILRMTSTGDEPRQALIKNLGAYRDQAPVTRVNSLRQLIAAACYRAPHERPNVPMLLLASNKDGLVNPQCSRYVARSWIAPLRMHASAGHDLPLDDGAWVAKQVREGLASFEV